MAGELIVQIAHRPSLGQSLDNASEPERLRAA